MALEGFTEEDMVIVEAGRKVAIAFGQALRQTISDTLNLTEIDDYWIAFADELSTFVMLTEK